MKIEKICRKNDTLSVNYNKSNVMQIKPMEKIK